MKKLVVATRRSALALAQTRAFVRALIESHSHAGRFAAAGGLEVEELQVVTSGDRIQDRPLYEAGGKGLFVKEIEEALLDRRADFAVHSMKDLPAHQPAGLDLACVPERADPRDVLLVREGAASIDALSKGARVGSSSLRRKIILKTLRPDLDVQPLRGNVDTRMKKLANGEYEAIVLAAAGLARLGVQITLPHAPIATTIMLPAVAQGTLAIEARLDDAETIAILGKMEHAPSRLRASAERGVLRALDADCTVPLAAHATIEGDAIHLDAWLADVDGTHARTGSSSEKARTPAEAEAIGLRLGATLKSQR
jgi:hydroxymethylbilane synthase